MLTGIRSVSFFAVLFLAVKLVPMLYGSSRRLVVGLGRGSS